MHLALQLLFAFLLPLSGESQNRQDQKRITNRIDRIKTVSDVRAFMSKRLPERSWIDIENEVKYYEPEYQRMGDSLHVQSYVKADFDNNGLTDILLCNRYKVRAILDKGNEHYEVHEFEKDYMYRPFPVVSDNKILLYHIDYGEPGLGFVLSSLLKTTLVYKFGGFIEENTTPVNYNIQSIEYSTKHFWNNLRDFNLLVYPNKLVIGFQKWYDTDTEKHFTALCYSLLSEDEYRELTDLLNYMDLPNLKDYYGLGSDAPSAIVKITLDNGKEISFEDNGLSGTFGLKRFHDLMANVYERNLKRVHIFNLHVWTKLRHDRQTR